MYFIIRQLNINHKVLREGTKNTENDRIKKLKDETL